MLITRGRRACNMRPTGWQHAGNQCHPPSTNQENRTTPSVICHELLPFDPNASSVPKDIEHMNTREVIAMYPWQISINPHLCLYYMDKSYYRFSLKSSDRFSLTSNCYWTFFVVLLLFCRKSMKRTKNRLVRRKRWFFHPLSIHFLNGSNIIILCDFSGL